MLQQTLDGMNLIFQKIDPLAMLPQHVSHHGLTIFDVGHSLNVLICGEETITFKLKNSLTLTQLAGGNKLFPL
jgi:hypothetical protein